VFLPMLAAAFLIVGCQIGMRPDESTLVWRSILLALILLIPLMISEKQAAADIDRGRFAARVFIVVGVLWMSCAFWLIATNSVLDADVGMSHTAPSCSRARQAAIATWTWCGTAERWIFRSARRIPAPYLPGTRCW